ncbi:MAG: hypothetical protein IKO26_07620 [Paludibacteraceae bacterium]|nr:hypothetical protein [Paludibacteraceae bacterium]
MAKMAKMAKMARKSIMVKSIRFATFAIFAKTKNNGAKPAARRAPFSATRVIHGRKNYKSWRVIAKRG